MNQYKYSKALFGTALEIKEQTRNPRFIAKRIKEMEISGKNTKKITSQRIKSASVKNVSSHNKT